jgi:tRNA/rRNA methyltransferase
MAAASSARLGGLFRKQALGHPDKIAAHLLDTAASAPVALVFGPEPTGLTNEEVARCNYLIHIPTNPEYPALNLAQAVAICLYELRRTWLKRTEVGGARRADAAPLADQERMFAHLQQALEEIHFLYGPKAESLMFALRHLIGRAGPTEMEVDLLFGLARQVRWFVEHGKEKGPQHE